MNYVGIDLHKKTIVLCVMNQDRKVTQRRTFACCEVEAIVAFFARPRPVPGGRRGHRQLRMARRADRAPGREGRPGQPRQAPRHRRESTKKTDKLDAQVLAEFLARDMIPEAHPAHPAAARAPRLVRHRQYLKQSATALKNKMRRIAGDYNADRKDLFTADGWESLEGVELSDADRFVLDQLHAGWQYLEGQLQALAERLKEFAAAAPAKEAEARAKLATIPGVGPVTDRRGRQRAGGRQPVPVEQGGLRLRRAGAGGAAERRQGEGSGDHQGRARRCCGGRWWRRPGG